MEAFDRAIPYGNMLARLTGENRLGAEHVDALFLLGICYLRRGFNFFNPVKQTNLYAMTLALQRNVLNRLNYC